MADPRVPSRPRALAAVATSALAAAGVVFAIASCERPSSRAPAHPPIAAGVTTVPDSASLACGRCHAAELAAWRASAHALANRAVDEPLDRAAFGGDAVAQGARLRWRDGAPEFARRDGGEERIHRAQAVIGVAPLRQYLVPFPGGRWQPIEPAYDVERGEWFAVANPPRGPDEWGHWSHRGSNWNSQCAPCHMTGFRRGWDERTDAYASTWDAMGVACASCHGPMPAHARRGEPPPSAERIDRDRADETCAPCHSRREMLTEDFRPGDSFHDHFRLTLPDAPAFHPDGQSRLESFEYASFQTSRMAQAGVRCADCHDPHSARPRAAIDDNALCAPCHGSPPARGAPAIDPIAHGRHAPGSLGNRCVYCHMPEASFMTRDRRRDHSFSAPDPRLAAELGVPDACASCHFDRDAAWRIARAEEWYGASDTRARSRRARLVARARTRDERALPDLMRATATEGNDVWRAALTSLLAPWARRPDAERALRARARDEHPLVRAAAVRGLHENAPAAAGEVARALGDDSIRLVRVDAAWVRAHDGETSGPRYEELARYVALESDQPPGAMRRGQLAWLSGNDAEAERWLRRAAAWDPGSATAPRFLGIFLRTRGDSAAAESVLAAARQRVRAGGGPSSAPMGGPHTGMPSSGSEGR